MSELDVPQRTYHAGKASASVLGVWIGGAAMIAMSLLAVLNTRARWIQMRPRR